jgi:hypothetical protein
MVFFHQKLGSCWGTRHKEEELKEYQVKIPAGSNLSKGIFLKQKLTQKYRVGKITRIRLNNTFDVTYDETEETETQMHPAFIRPVTNKLGKDGALFTYSWVSIIDRTYKAFVYLFEL